MAEYFDILQRLPVRPLLNVDFNYCYIPEQIAALKCYLVVRELQGRNIRGGFMNLFFVLITMSCILPNILHFSIWNVFDFGVIFSYSYVQALLFLHGRTVFIVYGMASFIGCLACSVIEAALDFYLIVSFLYNTWSVAAFRGYEITTNLLVARIILFFSVWWYYYMRNICFFLLFTIPEVIRIFRPRVFYYSLITIPSTLQFTFRFLRRASEPQQVMGAFPNITNQTGD